MFIRSHSSDYVRKQPWKWSDVKDDSGDDVEDDVKDDVEDDVEDDSTREYSMSEDEYNLITILLQTDSY